jgi:hypothetical protein
MNYNWILFVVIQKSVLPDDAASQRGISVVYKECFSGQAVSKATPVPYSGGPEFTSGPRDRLSFLSFFNVFLSHPM